MGLLIIVICHGNLFFILIVVLKFGKALPSLVGVVHVIRLKLETLVQGSKCQYLAWALLAQPQDYFALIKAKAPWGEAILDATTSQIFNI